MEAKILTRLIMKNDISKRRLCEFGFLLGVGIPFTIGWIIPLIWGHPFRLWTIFISFPFLILAIIKPSILFYPYKMWMALGHLLGWVNSRIIFTFIFFAIVFPMGLLMRLFKYDPLNKNYNTAISYRNNKKNHKIDLSRIF